jgi:hypothetical protein
VGDLVGRLLRGDEHEQPPEAVSVRECREAAPSRAQAQAVEGAQGDVVLVRHPPARVAELLPGQPDEPVAEASPQGLDGRVLAGLEAFEQA